MPRTRHRTVCAFRCAAWLEQTASLPCATQHTLRAFWRSCRVRGIDQSIPRLECEHQHPHAHAHSSKVRHSRFRGNDGPEGIAIFTATPTWVRTLLQACMGAALSMGVAHAGESQPAASSTSAIPVVASSTCWDMQPGDVLGGVKQSRKEIWSRLIMKTTHPYASIARVTPP